MARLFQSSSLPVRSWQQNIYYRKQGAVENENSATARWRPLNRSSQMQQTFQLWVQGSGATQPYYFRCPRIFQDSILISLESLRGATAIDTKQ